MLTVLSVLLSLFLSQAADLAGTRHTDPVPTDLQAPIAAKIAPGGVRVALAANALTFWWVKELALKPGATWGDLPEGSLVGAVKIDKDFRDIRGRVIRAGTYTLRYGIQPANGDHLGVSPFREFLLLSPVAKDADPEPLGHKGTVEISKETIGGSHPAVLSIDPPAATEAALALHPTELGHKAIVMEVPVQGGTLRFGLVLIGKIEA
jgi:hypothetical protein